MGFEESPREKSPSRSEKGLHLLKSSNGSHTCRTGSGSFYVLNAYIWRSYRPHLHRRAAPDVVPEAIRLAPPGDGGTGALDTVSRHETQSQEGRQTGAIHTSCMSSGFLVLSEESQCAERKLMRPAKNNARGMAGPMYVKNLYHQQLHYCTTVPLPGEQRSTGRGSGTGGTLDAWQESGATSNGHAANDFWTQRHLLVRILLHLLLHLLVHHRNLHDHLHQDLLQVMPPGERGNTLPMVSGHNLLEQNDIWTSKS